MVENGKQNFFDPGKRFELEPTAMGCYVPHYVAGHSFHIRIVLLLLLERMESTHWEMHAVMFIG